MRTILVSTTCRRRHCVDAVYLDDFVVTTVCERRCFGCTVLVSVCLEVAGVQAIAAYGPPRAFRRQKKRPKLSLLLRHTCAGCFMVELRREYGHHGGNRDYGHRCARNSGIICDYDLWLQPSGKTTTCNTAARHDCSHVIHVFLYPSRPVGSAYPAAHRS